MFFIQQGENILRRETTMSKTMMNLNLLTVNEIIGLV